METGKLKDFMLKSETARRLYEQVCDLPIYDYHCHLSPKEIYEDRRFDNIGELWLEADHYKWRIMRAYGIDERYITGKASYKEKFFKFAEALPHFVGNPVYHWVKAELAIYFDTDVALSPSTAEEIWQSSRSRLTDLTARRLIGMSGVKAVVTTDDPLSDLSYHKAMKGADFNMLPCFRFDRALNIDKDGFEDFVKELEGVLGGSISDFDGLISALEGRLDIFCLNGCVAADVSFDDFPSYGAREEADICLKKALANERATDAEYAAYKYNLLLAMAEALNRRDLVLQMHVGVMRNVNSSRFALLGADTGIDSLADAVCVKKAARLLDGMAKQGLPKTIIYTLNPNSYYPLATLLGDFAGGTRGRMQLGAAWWFMDSYDGIREQLRIFANTLGLGLFNGMLTDSRSFTSYARHDYFRRILCSLLAGWVDGGECSFDEALAVARDVSYYNAKNYFGGVR